VIVSEDFGTGQITGNGGENVNYTFTAQITGCTVADHLTQGSYTSTETETISSDDKTLSGSFLDSNRSFGTGVRRPSERRTDYVPPSSSAPTMKGPRHRSCARS
jgi:hypothetical protein